MNYSLTKNSRVDFTAYAPMHTFKGWAVKDLFGSIDIDFHRLELHYVKASVETIGFDTGNREKNEAMQEYFGLDRHPITDFTMTECREFCKRGDNSYQITVLGVLQFAGICRQLPITLRLNRDEEQLYLDLNFKWSFKAYGMKAPRLLFMNVRDIVDITAHLEFIPETSMDQ